VEIICFPTFQYRYRCRTRFCPFFHPFSSLYFFDFYIFEKRSKNLNIPASFLSFVNDGFLILQGKSFEKTNTFFCSYNIILSLLKQFGLVIKHRKSKIFYLSRSYRIFNFSSLISVFLENPSFAPKTSGDI